MKRKLATIRKVKDVIAHPNADNLNIVLIDGWKIVVRKDENITKNQLVMMFEIDSYLPIEPRYEFLRKYCYKKLEFKNGNPDGLRNEGFRLKTVKLRGVYSQGLVMGLSAFAEELEKISIPLEIIKGAMSDNLQCNTGTLKFTVPLDSLVGTDFTDILDIKVFQKPIPIEEKGTIKGDFPFSIPKTEQERVQNLTGYFEEMRNVSFEETEKINGKSMTVYRHDDEFGVCKRKWELFDKDDNIFWKVARELGLEERLNELGVNIAVQGELAGEGINKNPLGMQGKHFFVFNIWDIDKMHYLVAPERIEITMKLGLEHVPVINESIKIFQEYPIDHVDDLVARSRGASMVTKGRQREGIVFKSTSLINGQTVSFKVLDNEQLSKG